jgi:Bacterial Ig-like domain (group 3)
VFTANVTSTVGKPTGTVTFYDGSTLLGAASLNNGTAAYTTSSLAAGTHSVTAAYSGDSNFATVTSAAITETVADFSVAPPTGGSASATVSAGGQATYQLTAAPPSGQVFGAPITFTVTGLPAGATAVFSPASIPAGAGSTNVTLSIQLANTAKLAPPQLFGGGAALGVILLPFLRRRQRAQLIRFVFLAGIGGAAFILTLAGCGGSSSNAPPTQSQSYVLTVTATSGSSSHKTTLNLTIQ